MTWAYVPTEVERRAGVNGAISKMSLGMVRPLSSAVYSLRARTSGRYSGLAGSMKHLLLSWVSSPIPSLAQRSHLGLV